jgi:hypothetical protein
MQQTCRSQAPQQKGREKCGLRKEYEVAVICLKLPIPSNREARLEPMKVLRQIDPSMPLVALGDVGELRKERNLRSVWIFFLLMRPLVAGELCAVVECAIGKHNKKSRL